MTEVTPGLPLPKDPLVKAYGEHTIKLDPDKWTFSVTGPEFTNDKYEMVFKSLSDARDEIEKRAADSKRLQARNVTLRLAVVDGNGKPITIEKINRQNSELMGVETHEIYPNVTWIRESLRQARQLYLQIEDLTGPLRKFAIKKPGYGRIDADHYAALVESLKKDFAEKLEAARQEEARLAQELENPAEPPRG